MSIPAINFHIAEQMNLNPIMGGDGFCYINNGQSKWCMFGDTRLSKLQRVNFYRWAEQHGHGENADPTTVAIATGYVES